MASNFTDDFFEVIIVLYMIVCNFHFSECKFFMDLLSQMEDLKNWTHVLGRLNMILLEAGEKLNACNKLLLVEDDLNAKDTACKILKFLSLLLKASSDKRYFLSIEVPRMI